MKDAKVNTTALGRSSSPRTGALRAFLGEKREVDVVCT